VELMLGPLFEGGGRGCGRPREGRRHHDGDGENTEPGTGSHGTNLLRNRLIGL
jgi:hypothetical protein